ncbi:hypothetical protein ACFL5Z_11530 [Planctomycetota bacterium]
MSEQNDAKPIKDFRAGNIQASVWRNELNKDGQTVVRHSVRIQKQYRNKDRAYKGTEYYFRDDLPKLILVAQKAFEFVALNESKDVEESIPV